MNTNESFIAHLIELRTRLMHAIVALLLVFIGLFPWASALCHACETVARQVAQGWADNRY
jgi:Sec-independent protein secretion pathway component TatC